MQNRYDLIRNVTYLIDFVTQCWRVVVGINTIDYHGDDRAIRMVRAKHAYLGVNRRSRRGECRAQDDHGRRAIDGVDSCIVQYLATDEVVSIAKNGRYDTGHCAAFSVAADEIAINAHAFKSAV